jgi:hypothetical protein
VGIRISIEQTEPLIGPAPARRAGPLPFEGWLGLPGALSILVGTPGPQDSRGGA